MTLHLPSRRFNHTESNSSDTVADESSATSDLIVILAALLCAIVCLLGLIAIARCAWVRRFSGRLSGTSSTSPPHPRPNKGLNNKLLRKIPKITYTGSSDDGTAKYFDCAICLAEFVAGDVLRALPQCGHGFHVGCVDTWLRSHSSCPSCRQILVDTNCKKCNELTATENAVAGVENQIRPAASRRDDTYRFLP